MITQVCQYLHNWFNRKADGTDYPSWSGTFTITDGVLVTLSGELAEGQYYRIIGSLFNDGVHKFSSLSSSSLTDETFDGVVWSMGIPPIVVQLAEEIEAWQAKYGSVSNPAMSPFQSESFAGYSYSKKADSADGSANSWQNAFAARLSPWRKI